MKGNIFLQVLAGAVFVIGFIETIIGGLAHSVVKGPYGSWWGGAVCIGCGLSGMMQSTPNARAAGYCGSILAVIASLIALIVDAIGHAVVSPLDTCVNQNGEAFGNTSPGYIAEAVACNLDNDGYNCNCINNNQQDYCFLFNLQRDTQNCEQILGYYTQMLGKSANTLWVLFWLCVVYSVWFCAVQMCSTGCEQACCIDGCCTFKDDEESGVTMTGGAASTQYTNNSNPVGPTRPLEPGEQVVYVDGVPTIVRPQQQQLQQLQHMQQPQQMQQPQVVYVMQAPVQNAGTPADGVAVAHAAPPAYGEGSLNKV